MSKWLSVLSVLIAVSCGSRDTIGPTELTIQGKHALVRYNDQSLPAVRTRLPDRFGGSSVCNLQVTEGFLEIAAQSYTLEYVSRNSCNHTVLDKETRTGVLTRTGADLRFELTGSQPASFPGRIGASLIEVDYLGTQLTFDLRQNR